MYSKIEFITADRAAQLLGTVERNRSRSEKLSEAFSRDMLAGEWPVTPQGLIVRLIPDDNGAVIEHLEDGQHRCQAVRLAVKKRGPGFGVSMTVTYLEPGDPNIFSVLDTGRSRTFTDRLKIEGYANYTQLGAITRRLWDWDTGQPWLRSRQATRRELYVTLGNEEPELVEAARYAHSNWNGPAVLPQGLAGFSWFLFRNRVMVRTRTGWEKSDEDTSADADRFMKQLASGAALDEHDPILMFRKWRIQGAGQYTPRGKTGN